jgi:hypothetical protein
MADDWTRTTVSMNDTFEKMVRAAAVAGWWVVMVAVGFLTFMWVVYFGRCQWGTETP